MECDLFITQGKLKAAAEALFKKEALLEEVISDINRCGISTELAWSSLQKAFSGLQSSKLTGRVGQSRATNQLYIEIPIADEIAQIVIDVMGNAISEAPPGLSASDNQSTFLPPKPKGHTPRSVEPRVLSIGTPRIGLKREVSREFEGSTFRVSLGDLILDNHSFWLRVSVLQAPEELMLSEPVFIELAKVVWASLK